MNFCLAYPSKGGVV